MQDSLLEFVAPSPDDPDATGEEVLDEVVIADMGEHVLRPYMFVRVRPSIVYAQFSHIPARCCSNQG
jgi:hypothetical protein